MQKLQSTLGQLASVVSGMATVVIAFHKLWTEVGAFVHFIAS